MLFVVAAALYDAEQRIFMQQRPAHKPMAGLWEFPGGKVHSGETPQQALIRELQEELNIITDEAHLEPVTFITHGKNPASGQPDDAELRHATHADDMLLLLLYRCTLWEGILTPQENQAFIWAPREELFPLPMPPADRPLLAFL